MSITVAIETAIPFSGSRDGFKYNAHLVTFAGFAQDIAIHAPHALIFGPLETDAGPLVRAHSACRTGDMFGSNECDCGSQLTDSLRMMAGLAGQGRCGALLYLPHQEGRGIGLNEKIKAYDLMRREPGVDTYAANQRLGHPVDARDYTAAAQMINALGITRLRLLTGNPEKMNTLEALGAPTGFEITEQVPMPKNQTTGNARYLKDKELIGGHQFSSGPGVFGP